MMHLSELVRTSFIAATASVDQLKLTGYQSLQVIPFTTKEREGERERGGERGREDGNIKIVLIQEGLYHLQQKREREREGEREGEDGSIKIVLIQEGVRVWPDYTTK